MNAITRVASQNSTDFVDVVIDVKLPELKILILVFLVLISALGVVFVKDLNRKLFISHNKLQERYSQLQSESNKLLLEQSAWAAQSRVQMIAQQQLQMQIPTPDSVVVVKA